MDHTYCEKHSIAFVLLCCHQSFGLQVFICVTLPIIGHTWIGQVCIALKCFEHCIFHYQNTSIHLKELELKKGLTDLLYVNKMRAVFSFKTIILVFSVNKLE